MKIRKAYKYRLKTNKKLERLLARAAGCRRFVWNAALSEQKRRLDNKEPILSYAAMAASLLQWKADYPWLAEAPSQTLQQTLLDLDRALRDALGKKGKGFPAFKKRGRGDALRFPQGFRLDELNSRIYLPKIGWARYYNSRAAVGSPKQCHITSVNGKWHMAIQCEVDIPVGGRRTGGGTGIDLGVSRFAVHEDGRIIQAPEPLKAALRKLARAQRRLAKKRNGSSRRERQRHKVAKIHEKIGNIRKDFLHKTSTTLAKNHGLVVMEDLRVARMTRSSAGTVEAPGKGVARKSRLNRSILDQGWGIFRQMLEYKLDWAGGELIAVNPAYTSRTCPECHHEDKGNRVSRGVFKCGRCGFESDADQVGARNILAAGLAVSGRGGGAIAPPANRQPSVSAASAA